MSAPSIADRLATLPPIEVSAREVAIRSALHESHLDALVVTARANVRWLTGFTGSAGFVVLTESALTLVTDGRYTEQAAAQLASSGSSTRLEITSTEQGRIAAGAVGVGRRVGLEAEHVTWAAQRRYVDEWFGDRELIATSGLIERCRRSKDDAELARMEVAAAIADAALARHRRELLDRPTEREFAARLDATMRELGASGSSFETIVASGPNGALPHARPSDRVVVDGDLVVLDFGCIVDGYCSDMTRTVAIGDVTPDRARMLEVVAAANLAGVSAIRSDVPASAIDAAARSVIDAAGWGSAFSHGTGHGVGLDIHEAPRLGASSDDVLAVRDVVTVEPGVYLPAHGGVRIEDSVVVTADGARVLTHSTKSPTP